MSHLSKHFNSYNRINIWTKVRAERTRARQLRALFTTRLLILDTQYVFNSCSFNYKSDYSFLSHFLMTSKCFILMQISLKFEIWSQSYDKFANAKNNLNTFCHYLKHNISDIRLIPLDYVTYKTIHMNTKCIAPSIYWSQSESISMSVTIMQMYEVIMVMITHV